MKLSDLAIQMLNTPPVEWQKKVSALTADEQYDLWSELDDLAQNAATLGAYIGSSRTQPHEDAVKACMKRRVAVRKALEYSYPKSGTFTF